MRKKISIAVVAIALSTVVACGGGEDSDNQSPDDTEVLVKNAKPRPTQSYKPQTKGNGG
jgi:hypothetical protein